MSLGRTSGMSLIFPGEGRAGAAWEVLAAVQVNFNLGR